MQPPFCHATSVQAAHGGLFCVSRHLDGDRVPRQRDGTCPERTVIVSTKLLYFLTAAVLGVVMLAGACAMMLTGGGLAPPCTGPPLEGSSVVAGGIAAYDSEQVSNATIIVSVGAQLGVPVRGWVIAVAVALQESALHNSASGDHDSLGLFQQRPSQGWGTPTQLLDPTYASGTFYQKLLAIPGWQNLALTDAAQRVQRSAYPDAYAPWEPAATALVAAAAPRTAVPMPADLGPCTGPCLSSVASPSVTERACKDLAAVFERATSWLTAWAGGPVPYQSSGDPASWLDGYRRDCSGYVSMALGLAGPGLSTIDLAAQSTVIAKADLRPGDLMINPAPDLNGHVVLFDRWSDASGSSYYGYEQSGDGGTHHRKIPYPYFGTYPMTPYRLRPGPPSGE
jgi:hypothetical protein